MRPTAALAIEPRGLAREDAAAYVGVGTTLFDRMVQDGRMPKSARIDGRVIWDRRQLDRALRAQDDPDAPLPDDVPPGLIYFVGFGDSVKIGFTTNFPKRLKALQTTLPERLTVYVTMLGTTDAERSLHNQFAPDRLTGEWFRLSDAVLAFIKETRARIISGDLE